MTLKILHVNDHGLSVPRILNSAKTAKEQGNQVFFCGSSLYSYLSNSIFDKTFDIGWTNKKWLWIKWRAIKKQLKHVLDEIRPDIIHAHNVFAAKVVSEFDYPFIMDDHELFSLEFKASMYHTFSAVVPDAQFRLASFMCARWEKSIAERAPIITISEEIAKVYRMLTSRVFLVPNFPASNDIPNPTSINHARPEDISSAYLGADTEENPHQFRDITGLHDTFRKSNEIGKLVNIGINRPTEENISSLGFLPLNEAYQSLQNRCHIGLIPWKPHWFHKYCSPSKAFEYAHCGLYVMVTHQLDEVANTLGPHCTTFRDYSELADNLKYFKEHTEELNEKRKSALEFAKKNLIWEKYEQNVLDAYKCC
ncbi:MAG TPA: glycosyltransferase [Nitrososphaera sp.]|jgi:glycosyltransferase involved in cell wall biosynthesis|nr:glycosyltransferase [Nitrososphaera sp.]